MPPAPVEESFHPTIYFCLGHRDAILRASLMPVIQIADQVDGTEDMGMQACGAVQAPTGRRAADSPRGPKVSLRTLGRSGSGVEPSSASRFVEP